MSGLPYPAHEALLKKVRWYHSGDALEPYQATHEGRSWRIRLGDFPEEPMYMLLVNGVETIEFDDWPAEWGRLPKP